MNDKRHSLAHGFSRNVTLVRLSWERRAIARPCAGPCLTTLGSAINHTPIHKKSVFIYHSARS